jgi:hypothetical protein
MRRPLRLGELLLVCLVGVGSFLGAAAGGLVLGEQFDVVAIVQRGVGVLALVLALILELPTWRILRASILWSKSSQIVRKRLTALFCVKALMLIAITGVSLLLTPSVAIVAVFALVTALLLGAHWVVISHLDEPCRAGIVRDDVESQADRQSIKYLPPKGQGAPGMLVMFFPRIIDITIELLWKAWRVRLPITLPAVLLASLSVSCVVASAIGLIRPSHHHHKNRHTTSSTLSVQPYQPAQIQTRPSALKTKSSTMTPKPSWDGTCPSPPRQTEAKEPAISSITAMYRPTAEPSQIEKGCMDHIYPRHFHHEFYAVMTGAEPGTQTPLSLCIDSEAFGAAIFLWAVAPKIEELMDEVGPVGGPPVEGGRYPRYLIGESGGEMWLADTHKGIYMFARRASGEEWVKLTPTEVRALLGAMKDYDGGQWLWPSQPESRADGSQVVALRPGPDEKPVTVITLKPSGVATREHFEYRPYPIKEPSVKELTELALTAR